MSKVNIKVSLKTNEEENIYETIAIIQDEILKYKEKDSTTVILNQKKNTLQRENNEIKMTYPFQEKEESIGTIKIKELNRELKVKIKTIKIERKKKDIEIIFYVEDNQFIYHIEVLE